MIPVHRQLLAIALVPAVSLSCIGSDIRVEAQHGRVIVPDMVGRAMGEDLARSLDELTLQVAEFLSVPPCRGIIVRLLEEPTLPSDNSPLGGIRRRSRLEIHLGSICLMRNVRADVLAHELAHWHVQAHGWRMPYLLEEALCDFIGVLHAPMGTTEARFQEVAREGVEADPAFLQMSREELDALGPEETRRAVFTGIQLARSIGYPRLMELAARGDATPEDFEAAMRP